MDYAVAVYKFAASLPEQEKYNLASQLRRAVTSAPLNIAEVVRGKQYGVRRFWPRLSLSEEVVTLGTVSGSIHRCADRMQSLVVEGNQISRMTYALMHKVDPMITRGSV